MTTVQTLTGPVSPEDLGIVALRESLLFARHGWQWDPKVDFDRSAAFASILGALKEFKALGGGTIVDSTGITLGRNVPFYRRLAEVSGVKLVASTGFHSEKSSIPGHFLGRAYRVTTDAKQHWLREIPGHFYSSHGESKEYLMFLIYNELTEGMAAPHMIRSRTTAGIVQTGCAWDEVSRLEEYAIRGAAIAARHTGVSVMTNCARQAFRQFELLTSEGLAPERVVIGHRDDSRVADIARDWEFAEKGATVAYDHIGWEEGAPHAMPDERRVAMVKEMADAGFADRVVLSCSAVGVGLGQPATRHRYAHLLNDFVPRLRNSGVSEDAIRTMLVENPKRILSARQDEEAAARLRAFAEGFRQVADP